LTGAAQHRKHTIMNPSGLRWMALGLALLAGGQADLRAARQITVTAGESWRRHTPITFKLPPDGATGAWVLQAPAGTLLPLQVDEDHNATFILPALARGATTRFTLLPRNNPARTQVTAQREGTVLKLDSPLCPLLRYQMEPSEVPGPEVSPHYRHGGYLHPVFNPAGRIVTGDYPPDHRHHRGIWFAWTKTEFEGRHPDFWNMGKEKEAIVTAGTRFAALETSWSGPVHAGFVSRQEAFDRTGPGERVVLNERWRLVHYAPRTNAPHLFDLTIEQTCATASPLKLPKYHYGGLGVRGHESWNPKDKVEMLTSAGHDRKNGDSTKARWVWMGGEVEGAPAGLAVLIHPENFRFPQPLRLNPNNPQLCVAPSQGGDWEITPGKPYVSKYRFAVFHYKPEAQELERLWKDYAHPPEVTVE
jgi:hypothetical protein